MNGVIRKGTIVRAPSGRLLYGAGWKFVDDDAPDINELAAAFPETIVDPPPSIGTF